MTEDDKDDDEEDDDQNSRSGGRCTSNENGCKVDAAVESYDDGESYEYAHARRLLFLP